MTLKNSASLANLWNIRIPAGMESWRYPVVLLKTRTFKGVVLAMLMVLSWRVCGNPPRISVYSEELYLRKSRRWLLAKVYVTGQAY